MKFNFKNLLIVFVWLGYTSQLSAQKTESQQPQLVVGIMINGLQKNHIDRLWNYFDTNGFKKLISQGCVVENVNYNFVSSGNASDLASLLTGSLPYYHGIIGNKIFNKENRTAELVIHDKNEIGIGTSQTFSSHNLLTSTINDELRMAYPNESNSFAIGIDALSTVLMGGHTAQSVSWIDDEQLKWVTTGYFTEGLSQSAYNMNLDGSFAGCATNKWKPLFSTNTYLSANTNQDKNGFEYLPTATKSKSSKSTILYQTPNANALVSALALKTIADQKLGTDKVPDMLMLQFTVETPNERFSVQNIEKEDMYLRLDKEIQFLLQQIDVMVGLNKTLIFVLGNQYDAHSPNELGENKIPAGYFSANRSMALVNTYLMALYGQERWIDGYYAKNIYLNKAKIEEKKLNFAEIQRKVAEFMLEFEGVQNAYPAVQLLNLGAQAESEQSRIRNSVHKAVSGDIIITLSPGWLELDENNRAVGKSNSILSCTPVYFFGNNLKAQTIEKMYQITDIAPSIARMLNIPYPNACIGKPIDELFLKK